MAKKQPDHQARVVQDPAIMVGKPIVKGTRIPVERVIQHLADTPDFDDLLAAFPQLTLDDVKACLAYASAALERECDRERELGAPATRRSASA